EALEGSDLDDPEGGMPGDPYGSNRKGKKKRRSRKKKRRSALKPGSNGSSGYPSGYPGYPGMGDSDERGRRRSSRRGSSRR
ncbi:MAG: hypothetical protein ACE5KM_14220, partial [Planctomycetaceae bacterium]